MLVFVVFLTGLFLFYSQDTEDSSNAPLLRSSEIEETKKSKIKVESDSKSTPAANKKRIKRDDDDTSGDVIHATNVSSDLQSPEDNEPAVDDYKIEPDADDDPDEQKKDKVFFENNGKDDHGSDLSASIKSSADV